MTKNNIEGFGRTSLSDEGKRKVRQYENLADILTLIGSVCFTFGTLGLLSTISVLLAIAACGIELGGLGFLLGYVLRQRYGNDLN